MMKRITIILLLLIGSFSSCGPTEVEQANAIREKCEAHLKDPIFNAYYSKAYIRGHRQALEACGDKISLLETEYDNLLDKVAEAHAEYEIQKAMEGNQ